jgi:hypothetical protein
MCGAVAAQEIPCQAPLGYFDPLGLSKDGDVETFRRRREAELKNGRVAMFATIGSAAATVTSFESSFLRLFYPFLLLVDAAVDAVLDVVAVPLDYLLFILLWSFHPHTHNYILQCIYTHTYIHNTRTVVVVLLLLSLLLFCCLMDFDCFAV